MALTQAFTTLLLCLSTISAHPVKSNQQPLQLSSWTPCDSVATYTTDWFLHNTLPEYRQAIDSNAIFYTRGAGEHARKLACNSKSDHYVTIWDIWPENLYNESQHESNPLRCIHKSSSDSRTFYSSMSAAYAKMTRKTARVMHLTKDYTSPPSDGIWATVELPELRDSTDVKSLLKLSEDLILKEPVEVEGKTEWLWKSRMYATNLIWKKVGKRSWFGEESHGSCKYRSRQETARLDGLF